MWKESLTMNFRKTRSRSNKNSVNVVRNSEKWQKYGRRMSLRQNSSKTYDVDTDSSEEDITVDRDGSQDWDEFFGKKHLSTTESDQDVEVQLTRKQTLILSTLVPDEILTMDSLDSSEPQRFVGVLMMADVSGYTSLSERYNNTGKGGTCRLTVTLNTYLGSLIDLIYSHGGDVIKFAGDAFLALWKTDKRSFLCHTIHTVIACALIIQHTYGTYETDVKVNLRVKLAISAGNLIFAPIGSDVDMNYVIFGLPVIEAKYAESVCASGEVKLSATAWGHCYSRNYDHVVNEDGSVTIKSILYDPHEKDVTKPFIGFSSLLRQVKKPFAAIENLPDSVWETNPKLKTVDVLKNNDLLSLRKSIFISEERNIGSELRRFMIRPIVTQVDAHQPLEYLTEMRQVSVLFITLKPRNCPYMQLLTIVNNTYQIICEIVYKSMGCVNKIILFDKDVMILVIFGLRGFKHESEAQAALKCGYSIKKSVSALDGVDEVSVGVTTGQVYCGVVGHPLRREFTVIGAVVNKAARLMCKFRNKITCDETTFIKSKMSTNGFTLQPTVELKGIGRPGKIFEYTEEIRVKEMYNIEMIAPLLDRLDEMEYFKAWLDDRHLPFRDFDALLLIGDSRIGKSRMLEWMARFTKNAKLSVCFVALTSIHSATPYLALSQIFEQILGFNEHIMGFAKEEKIVQLLNGYSEDLCYLNEALKVRFAYHDGVYLLSNAKRTDKARVMFNTLTASISETFVIFLDDLQNLDQASWEFILLMFNCSKMFFVITVTRGKFSAFQNWLYGVFIHNSVRKIVLGPLSSEWIAPLACQILDVNAVPTDLCEALLSKCKRMPGLIESFIVHLFSSGALQLHKIPNSELDNWSNEYLQFPDPQLLHPQALEVKNQSTLDLNIHENCQDEISICVVTQKDELNTNINEQNLDAIIMIQIDSLTPYQQLLLKIASVIGSSISRDLLENIMYENNYITTAKAIKRLFAMRIFCCANASSKWNRKKSTASEGSILLSCECSFEYDPKENECLPKYAFCKVMKFKNKSSRKTCYELLPTNQKKEFHSRIVHYLENKNQKCPNCGGNIIIVEPLIDTVDEEPDDNQSSSDSDVSLVKFNSKTTKENDVSSEDEAMSDVSSDVSTDIGEVKQCNIKRKSIFLESNLPSIESGKSGIINASNRNTSVKKKMTLSDTEDNYYRRISKRVTISSFRHIKLRNKGEEEIKINFVNEIRSVVQASNLDGWHTLGIVDSIDNLENDNPRKHFNLKMEKGVSQTDFLRCSCSEVNIVIYEQLIHHATQAEMKNKMILFLIKYSYFNILDNNYEIALPKLDAAQNECFYKPNQEFITTFQKRLFLGKIYSLRSLSHFKSGKYYPAKIEMERALRMYRINLRKNTFPIVANIMKMCKLKKYRDNDKHLEADSIFCLNVATLLYCALTDEKQSRSAAFRALDLVQKVKCNIADLCDTFANALQIETERGLSENADSIENVAISTLNQLPRPIQSYELHSIGKLFMAIFRARLAKGELPSSIRCGFRAIVISRFLHADYICLDIIPKLFYLLLARGRIYEAVELLSELKNLEGNKILLDGLVWHNALCMDMILDCGLQVESPNTISRFAENFIERNNNYAGPARRRLVVNLWTYWLRMDVEGKAKKFESEALKWNDSDEDDGELTSILSALRLAEGLLESLAKKIDDLRKVVDLMELRSLADHELARIEGDARICRTVYPRLMLLKAYSLSLSGRQAVANSILNQVIDESRRIHNRLEEEYARAALGKSTLWLQSARNGRFTSWEDGVNICHSHWHNILYNINTSRK